jgi:hypothetical protein
MDGRTYPRRPLAWLFEAGVRFEAVSLVDNAKTGSIRPVARKRRTAYPVAPKAIASNRDSVQLELSGLLNRPAKDSFETESLIVRF